MSKKQLKKPQFQRGQRIEVEWHDHWARLGWDETEKCLKAGPMVCKTVGYFVGYSPDGDLTMASTLDEANQVNNVSYRLWSAVTKIRKLK